AVEPAEKDLVIIVDDDRVTGKANVIFGEVHDLTLPGPGPGVRLSAPPPDPLGWSGDHHLQQARRGHRSSHRLPPRTVRPRQELHPDRQGARPRIREPARRTAQ